MEQLMDNLLYGTFLLYLMSSVAFVVGATGDRNRVWWGNVAMGLAIVGVLLQIGFIVTRILIGGHFPTSNMFEFTAFLRFALVIAFIVIFFIYRTYVLGVFAMPLAVILLAYASVFPKEVEPLIPALQSHWLYIHVTTAALGQGAFAVGCVAGLIYLVHQIGQKDRKTDAHSWFLELTFVVLVMFIGYSLVSFLFSSIGYQAQFTHVVDQKPVVENYKLPPISAPHKGQLVSMDSLPGFSGPYFEVPTWMKGENAASKLNAVIWSVITGLLLYGVYYLLARKPLHQLLHPFVKRFDLELLDEISYRAIAIGYPIFTLGGLVFAAIWANEAWGRPWGWDPKETWAFITWMFYSAYLHLRLSRGWFGLKSSWLAVGGFVIIMINLIVINLVVSGLHSYA